MSVNERLKQLRESLGLTPTKFSAELGVPRTTLIGWEAGKAVPIETLSRLQEKFSMSIEWMLSGEGPMQITDEGCTDNPSQIRESLAEFQAAKALDATGIDPVANYRGQGVPYYDVDVAAHISEMLERPDVQPDFYVDFKPFNDCTAYLPVCGDSMFPSIQSGDIVALKKLNTLELILWGEAHMVVTNSDANNLRTVKLVFPHEDPDKVILRASNPNFRGDMIVRKEHILAMYLVKGIITRKQL